MSEYLNVPYLVVMDNVVTTVYPTTDDMQFILLWRRIISPVRIRLTSDEYWQYAIDQENLVGICRQPRIWERTKIRGIIDLRDRPIRFEVIGRKFLPYMTEWDILMKLAE